MANLETAKMFSLEGQTALVTGGTRGIGQAAAIALAEAGADIILIQVYFSISLRIRRFISWEFY
jgi:2-deoxy-D-gluconate 3-dehydrogenase